MQDQSQPSCGDFGNFQLGYGPVISRCFPNLKYIDEKYVALLQFSAPGASVRVVLTAMQLEIWRDCFELRAAHGGVSIQTLPIMRPKREDEHLDVTTYGNELSFTSGTMVISISLTDCLKDFTSYINKIYCKLNELEDRR